MSASDPADTIRVTVNGEAQSVPSDASVAGVLEHLDFDPGQAGVAVAVEGEVVRRQDWGDTRLSEGENVEVITAQQGG